MASPYMMLAGVIAFAVMTIVLGAMIGVVTVGEAGC
jgi:hypothetical protein